MEATLIKPIVGEGASVSNGVDVHSMTIISVSENGKTVTAQRDSAKILSGSAPYSNLWEITPSDNGYICEFTLRKNGRFVLQGESAKNGNSLQLGGRREYYSYEF
jgi:tricorn protease-like protein